MPRESVPTGYLKSQSKLLKIFDRNLFSVGLKLILDEGESLCVVRFAHQIILTIAPYNNF